MNPTKPSRRVLRAHELAPQTDSRYVGMTRGSTPDQKLTLGAQRDGIERYVGALKQGELVKVFDDSGTGGKEKFLDRPVVREVLGFMDQTGIRNIVCTRFDRYFRSLGDGILTLHTLFQHGVMLHFCEQNIDPTTPSGRAMFHVFGTMAEWETDIRRERQLEAFDQQRKLGQKSGVNVRYGWIAVPSPGRLTRERRPASDLAPHPQQQQLLGEILRRHEDGETDKHIAAVFRAAGFKTALTGKTVKRNTKARKALKLAPFDHVVKGEWTDRTVFSIRSFARLADPRLVSRNPDEVEEAVAELSIPRGSAQPWPSWSPDEAFRALATLRA